jgi:hypothetical protein
MECGWYKKSLSGTCRVWVTSGGCGFCRMCGWYMEGVRSSTWVGLEQGGYGWYRECVGNTVLVVVIQGGHG